MIPEAQKQGPDCGFQEPGRSCAPTLPPSGAGHADLCVRGPFLQHQCAYAHLVLDPPQPRAGGAHRQVEPFSIDLGGTASKDPDLPRAFGKTCPHSPSL